MRERVWVLRGGIAVRIIQFGLCVAYGPNAGRKIILRRPEES